MMAPQYIADIAITVEGDMLRVTFPYDAAIIDRLRTVPGRRWDVNKRAWLVPKLRWKTLKEVLGDIHSYTTSNIEEALT
jgi:hypothetical protein